MFGLIQEHLERSWSGIKRGVRGELRLQWLRGQVLRDLLIREDRRTRGPGDQCRNSCRGQGETVVAGTTLVLREVLVARRIRLSSDGRARRVS